MLTDDEVDTWTGALRSDEYIQGRGAMCRETPCGVEWCPLGLLVNEIWSGDWVLADDGFLWGLKVCGNWYGDLPPVSVAKVPSILMGRIIQHNDYCRWSFREIADWIESWRDAFTKEW